MRRAPETVERDWRQPSVDAASITQVGQVTLLNVTITTGMTESADVLYLSYSHIRGKCFFQTWHTAP